MPKFSAIPHFLRNASTYPHTYLPTTHPKGWTPGKHRGSEWFYFNPTATATITAPAPSPSSHTDEIRVGLLIQTGPTALSPQGTCKWDWKTERDWDYRKAHLGMWDRQIITWKQRGKESCSRGGRIKQNSRSKNSRLEKRDFWCSWCRSRPCSCSCAGWGYEEPLWYHPNYILLTLTSLGYCYVEHQETQLNTASHPMCNEGLTYVTVQPLFNPLA